MKSQLKQPSTKPKPTFPALYKHKTEGYTVLFVNERRGLVVDVVPRSFLLGEWSDDWVFCTDVTLWERLPAGSVVELIQE